MKKPLSFCLILWLGSTFLAGCAAQTKNVRPDRQNPDHRRVGETFVPLLRAAGREPASCQAFFFETEALNAVSMGNCTFGFSTGLASTGDVKLIRGVGAHEIGHEMLGHADKRKAAVATEQVIRTAVSFIPGIYKAGPGRFFGVKVNS